LLPGIVKGFSPEQSIGYPISSSSIYCNGKESWFFNPSLQAGEAAIVNSEGL